VETPKTKDAVAALKALSIDGRALIVVQRSEVAVAAASGTSSTSR
jgi:ribosomal protein L4